MTSSRGPRHSWRLPDRRVARPERWLAAAFLVGMLLVEVWQNSHRTELCLSLERHRTALQRAQARVAFVRAGLERRTTRAELTPLASQLGLAPIESQQLVVLPAEYLASAPSTPDASPPTLLALVDRASHALVPEARAKSRIEN